MPIPRVTIDLAFPADDKGEMAPDVADAYAALVKAIESARPLCCWPNDHDDATIARVHLCRHDTGEPCSDVAEIGEAPEKIKAADAVAELATGARERIG
jgi:hypothetical protein